MRRALAALLCALLMCSAAWAEDTGRVADPSEQTEAVAVLEEGMTPVGAEMLNEGLYPVAVKSSSSMFKVASAELAVANGRLSARLTIASDAYEYLYPGTAEEAAAAPREALIAGEALPGGGYVFALPIGALDAETPCAAFSRRKQQWYPRTLLFRADSLPEAAYRAETTVTAQTLGLEDGAYTVEAMLSGGSGKTQLFSPARLTVKDGAATALIAFNTKRIDYLKIGEEKLLPLEGEESAAFEMPVSAFDREIAIIVDSTAMKPSVEVGYTVRFEAETIEKFE